MNVNDKIYGTKQGRYTTVILLLWLTGWLLSCREKSLASSQISLLSKTTLMITSDFTIETCYQYDIESRLIRLTQTNPKCPQCGSELGNELNVYKYATDSLTKTDKISQTNSLTGNHTYTLNKWGFAIADYLLQINTAYSYDENGYLLRKQLPYTPVTTPQKYATTVRQVKDQNIVKEVVDQPGYEQATTTFEYDLGHANRIDPLSIFAEGKQSRNLLIKETTVHRYSDPLNPTPLIITTHYSYQFDERDRVIEQTIREINPNYKEPLIRAKRFEYSN